MFIDRKRKKLAPKKVKVENNFLVNRKATVFLAAFLFSMASCKSYKLRDAISDSTVKRIHLLTVAIAAPPQLFGIPKPNTGENQNEPYHKMYMSAIADMGSGSSQVPRISGKIVKSGSGCSGECIEWNSNGGCIKFAGPKILTTCPDCRIISKPISSRELAQGMKSIISNQILTEMKGIVEPQSVSEKLPGFKEIRKILDTEIALRFEKTQNIFDSSTLWEGFFYEDPRWKEFLEKNPGEAFLVIKVPVSYTYTVKSLPTVNGLTEQRFNCKNMVTEGVVDRLVSGIKYEIFPFLYSAHDPKQNLFYPYRTFDTLKRPEPIAIELSQDVKIEGKVKKLDWEFGKLEFEPTPVNPLSGERIVAEALKQAPGLTKIGIQAMTDFIEKEKQHAIKK